MQSKGRHLWRPYLCIILLFHFNGILGALGKALTAAYAFIIQHLMLTLQFSLNCLEIAILRTDCTAYAFVFNNKGFFSVCKVGIYGFCRTYFSAHHTIDTLAVIYLRNIVFNLYCIKFACFHTFLASNAADFAGLHRSFAFILIPAKHSYLL